MSQIWRKSTKLGKGKKWREKRSRLKSIPVYFLQLKLNKFRSYFESKNVTVTKNPIKVVQWAV